MIIPLLLLHLYMYYQISCNFGEISFLFYFSNHFYLKKKGHAEIISVMCSLFTFRVYSNIISFSWKKNPRNRFTLFLQYSQQTIIKRYIAYTCTGYWNIPWTAETIKWNPSWCCKNDRFCFSNDNNELNVMIMHTFHNYFLS